MTFPIGSQNKVHRQNTVVQKFAHEKGKRTRKKNIITLCIDNNSLVAVGMPFCISAEILYLLFPEIMVSFFVIKIRIHIVYYSKPYEGSKSIWM